jgi:hypothetical protein
MRVTCLACAWFAGIAAFAWAGAAAAQVNTENLRKRIKHAGYSVIVEESLTGDWGNTQGVSVGAGLGGGWARDPHLIFAYARLDYTKYNGVSSVNKTFAHARYNYEIEEWLWGEAFAQAQSDAFQRLDLRYLFGAGPRARIAHFVDLEGRKAGSPPVSSLDAYLGTAYMFEQDEITAVVGAIGPQNRHLQVWHRWSNYLTLQWQIDPRSVIATTAYVQPAFDTFRNVRVLVDTLLTFKVTKYFSAEMAASVRYGSQPPTGVLRTDVEVRNVLALTF